MRNINTITVATGRALAKHVANDVRQQMIKYIETKADQWLSENKLVHAGAARQLAQELKNKFIQQNENK